MAGQSDELALATRILPDQSGFDSHPAPFSPEGIPMGARRRGEPRRTAAVEFIEQEFPSCLARVDILTGSVRVLELDEVPPAERDDVTRWALRMLRSIGMPVSDPLSLRDALWK